MTGTKSQARKQTLLSSEEGGVLVEYMAVWGFTIIGATLAIVKLGPGLLLAWGAAKTVLLANHP